MQGIGLNLCIGREGLGYLRILHSSFFCAVGIVQFSGINALFYITPQILMQAGTGDLLASMGIDEESSSILASGVMCLPMLPCVVVAMWLMDISGRRYMEMTLFGSLQYM